MKTLLVGLFAIGSLSAFATSEKILKYIGEGKHIGPDCQVIVQTFNFQGKKTVSVNVENGNDLAIFNSSINGKMYQESASTKTYTAAVEVIPNDSYTGVRRYFIEITKDVYQAEVTVVEKRRFLGIWTTEREASCNINI